MSHLNSSNRSRSTRTLVLLTLCLASTSSSDHPYMRGAGAARAGFVNQGSSDPFEGGVAWLNTGGPIRLKELRGKIVLLDFWTYCCINCHHVLPDLAKLEEKYKNELVVIGVHTPKFHAEGDTENIRQKVREYRIKHPVISDANMVIWRAFGVNSWPTLVVIDPGGKPVGSISGEGHYAILDREIGKLVAKHKAKGDLNETPVKFFPENEKPDNTPLLFPGKVLADAKGKRLFIADTGHNRIVLTDLEGKGAVAIGDGSTGFTDGPFAKAQFHRPQGMALVDETLYVADTENHAIRAADLRSKMVSTVAGTGEQAQRDPRVRFIGPGKTSALNSPWDLAHVPATKSLYIAMAGPHQIWRLDLETGRVAVFAGTGNENITDGAVEKADFAQPSGLATDGTHLYVADSEVSALRMITLAQGKHVVQSIVGKGLFDFGDVDGVGPEVRLQHCLGVTFGDGKLYVADTYNNKIKQCDPKSRSVKVLSGTGEPGSEDNPPRFYQPGGLSLAGGKLYVADTNNQAIRVVDLSSGNVQTLPIDGLSPPAAPQRQKPVFPRAIVAIAAKAIVKPGKEISLDVTLPLEAGYKINAEGSMPFLVETPGKAGIIDAEMEATGGKIEPPDKHFTLKVKLAKPTTAGDAFDMKVSVSAFVCNEGSNFCTIKSYVWNVPVTVTADGNEKVTIGP